MSSEYDKQRDIEAEGQRAAVYHASDDAETTTRNPKSYVAWKKEAGAQTGRAYYNAKVAMRLQAENERLLTLLAEKVRMEEGPTHLSREDAVIASLSGGSSWLERARATLQGQDNGR